MNLFTALQEVLQLIQKMKFKMVRDLFYHIDGYKEACTNSILQFENICVLTGIDLEVEEKS